MSLRKGSYKNQKVHHTHKLSASRLQDTKIWMASSYLNLQKVIISIFVLSNKAIVYTWPNSSYHKTIAISHQVVISFLVQRSGYSHLNFINATKTKKFVRQ